MSREPDPSYYEVALTSRQVAAGFVILLGCLVAAFFSGVWVGKGGTRETRVAVEPAASGAETPELRVIPGEAEAPATGGLGTTLAEDLAADGESAARGGSEPESGAAARRPPQQPAPTSPPARPRPQEPAPARPAAPAAKAPAAQAPATQAPAAQAPAAGETFVIQVLSSRDQAKARQTLGWLRDGGYPASLSTVDQGGQVMYRVRVGPYRDRPAAARVADEVRRKFKLDTWVTAE